MPGSIDAPALAALGPPRAIPAGPSHARQQLAVVARYARDITGRVLPGLYKPQRLTREGEPLAFVFVSNLRPLRFASAFWLDPPRTHLLVGLFLDLICFHPWDTFYL